MYKYVIYTYIHVNMYVHKSDSAIKKADESEKTIQSESPHKLSRRTNRVSVLIYLYCTPPPTCTLSPEHAHTDTHTCTHVYTHTENDLMHVKTCNAFVFQFPSSLFVAKTYDATAMRVRGWDLKTITHKQTHVHTHARTHMHAHTHTCKHKQTLTR